MFIFDFTIMLTHFHTIDFRGIYYRKNPDELISLLLEITKCIKRKRIFKKSLKFEPPDSNLYIHMHIYIAFFAY